MEKEENKNKEQNNTEEVIKDKSEIKNSEEKEVKKQQIPAEKIKDPVTRTYADYGKSREDRKRKRRGL